MLKSLQKDERIEFMLAQMLSIYVNGNRAKGSSTKDPNEFIIKSFWKTEVEQDVDVFKKLFWNKKIMAAQTLANIAIKLSANMVDFENDLGRANRLAGKRAGQMKKSFNAAFVAIGAAAFSAGGAIGALVKVTANTADNIQKLSIRLGVTTEFLSEMRHAADLSGVSFEKVNVGVAKMSKSINDADNGLSTAKRAFDQLGISLEDLHKLKPEEQFLLIADKLSKVESQSLKTGAAMDIFGRAGAEMITLFDQGADGIKEMREEANRFGLTISNDSANAAALI